MTFWYSFLQSYCAVLKGPGDSHQFPVAMARGKHLFPFRTEQLSPSAPMVLGPQGPGRVGRRRFFDDGPPPPGAAPCWPAGAARGAAAPGAARAGRAWGAAFVVVGRCVGAATPMLWCDSRASCPRSPWSQM